MTRTEQEQQFIEQIKTFRTQNKEWSKANNKPYKYMPFNKIFRIYWVARCSSNPDLYFLFWRTPKDNG